jgi:DNA repair ATPase RecN
MKTFDQFVSEITHAEAVYQMTEKLVEHDVDPVLYAYLRLAENVPPAQAAVGAPGGGSAVNEIGQLAQAVNGILTKYGKTMPNVGKVATNMNKEVQALTAAAQQDAQAAQQAQSGQQQPMKPGQPMQPGQQQPMKPGQQQPMKPGQQQPMKPGQPMQQGQQQPMQPGQPNQQQSVMR